MFLFMYHRSNPDHSHSTTRDDTIFSPCITPEHSVNVWKWLVQLEMGRMQLESSTNWSGSIPCGFVMISKAETNITVAKPS